MNHIKRLTSSISKSIISQTNEMIREGLKMQGHEFMNDEELVYFIRNNCKCVSVSHDDGTIIRTYSVNDKPFIMHIMNALKMPEIVMDKDGDVKVGASIGSFNFINN